MSEEKTIRSALQSYYESLDERNLSIEEEEHNTGIIFSGDRDNPTEEWEDAVETMWNYHLRLVITIVGSMFEQREVSGICLDDAIAYGRIGLREAVIKFDPHRKRKFSTYARYWIRKHVKDAANTKGNASGFISIPASACGKVKRVSAARWRFMCDNGREPTEKELSKMTGISEGSVKTLARVSKWKRTQDIYIENSEVTADRGFANFEKEDSISHMRKAFNRLDDREKRILILRNGLDGEKSKKLGEVKKLIPGDLSRERIRQIQETAIAKLRDYMEDDAGDEEIDYCEFMKEDTEQ